MQKDEILTLLKIVRGVSASPNLSFVYAFDRGTVERALFNDFDSSSNTYFEKFFPVSVRVPAVDAEALRTTGIHRLLTALQRRRWFEIDSDETIFTKEIEKIWNDLIAPFCQTLRGVGLLGNDVGVAASPLKGEVNPVDLTLIELLRRFEPSVYEIVWRYRDTLTGGESWLSPSHRYRSDAEKDGLKKRLIEDLRGAVGSAERLEAVRKILDYLFPLFAKIDGDPLRSLHTRRREAIEDDRKISDPSLITAYFRYKLPEDLFSVRELTAFLRRFDEASDPEEGNREFLKVFDYMQNGDPRRSDFLNKLADRVQLQRTSLSTATALVHVCMHAAHRYVYDSSFVGLGEAGHVLRIIIRVALRLPAEQRTALLSQCIDEATDDTMALRIQTVLSKPGRDFDLSISFSELYPSFVKRMRTRYGRDVDLESVNLSFSDPRAFNLWGAFDLTKEGIIVDPEDRAIQRDFWLRHIGNSKSRLAQTFSLFFMPEGIYQGDPVPFVENKIPLADLQNLYRSLTEGELLSEADRKALRRLGSLLIGEFKNGIGLDVLGGDEDVREGAESSEEEPSL